MPDDQEWEDILGSGAVLKKTLREGEGTRPERKQTMHVHLTIRTTTTSKNNGRSGNEPGKVVYDTRGQQPLSLQCGDTNADMISGVLLVCQLMFVGERALYRLDPRHAYGDKGSPELGVPPSTWVECDVELVGLGQREKEPEEMSAQELVAAVRRNKDRGNELFRQDDLVRALACYKVATGKLGQSAVEDAEVRALRINCWNNQAAVLERLEQYPEAKDAIVEVLKEDPNNFKALLRGASIALLQNEFEEAALALQRAQEAKPDSALVRKKLRELRDRKDKHRKQEQAMFMGWAERERGGGAQGQAANKPSSNKEKDVPTEKKTEGEDDKGQDVPKGGQSNGRSSVVARATWVAVAAIAAVCCFGVFVVLPLLSDGPQPHEL